jgi:ABC-type transport system involved in Fe-S cluster assembly, permease component
MRDDVLAAGRASSGASWLSGLRAEAGRAWRDLPWPEPKDPEWRYSPSSLFSPEEFSADGAADLISGLSPASGDSEPGDERYASVLRFVGGASAACCLDATAPEGVSVSLGEDELPIAAARLIGAESLRGKLRARALAEAGPFVGIRVSRKASLAAPILVDWVEDRSGAYVAPLIFVALESGARASIELRWRAADQGRGDARDPSPGFLLSPLLLLDLGPGSRLELLELVSLGERGRFLDFPEARLGKAAELSWRRGFFGARAAKSSLGALLEGEGARLELREAAASAGAGHIDLGATVRHSGPRGYSRVSMDGVADGEGASFASGLLAIEKGAQGADAYLSSRQLSLSPKAKVMSMPELSIDTDDLKASHGSTIGSIGADELFYLESRGLSPAEAKAAAAAGLLARFAEGCPPEQGERVERLVEDALHA